MENVKKHLLSLSQTERERQWLQDRLADLPLKEGTQLAAGSGGPTPQNGMEAINCLLTMHDYGVRRPAGNYEALGRFYLRHEGGLPAELLPFVDTGQLGQVYEDMHPGLFIGGLLCVLSRGIPSIAHTMERTWNCWRTTTGASRSSWLSPSRPRGPAAPGRTTPCQRWPPDEAALALRELGVVRGGLHAPGRQVFPPEISSLVEQYDDPADLIRWQRPGLQKPMSCGQGMPALWSGLPPLWSMSTATYPESCPGHLAEPELLGRFRKPWRTIQPERAGKQGFPPRDAP